MMPASPTLRRLLAEHVAILAPTKTTGTYGDDSLTYPEPDEVEPTPARLEQTAGTEVSTGRDTQISDWLLYLPPDVEISGDSRVVRLSDGRTFEVLGPPNVLVHPRTGPHHIEARLVTYEGTA